MVIVRNKGIRGGDCVLPCHMIVGKGRVWMVQSVAVKNVAQDLAHDGSAMGAPKEGRGQPTSRRKRPLIKSMAMAHGIGKLVLIFRALRICSILVKSSSTLDCMATPRSTLPVLTSATFHHRPLTPPCSSPIGKADSPCSLTLTARLETAPSNARNPRAGRR